jgi:hypothetical protein
VNMTETTVDHQEDTILKALCKADMVAKGVMAVQEAVLITMNTVATEVVTEAGTVTRVTIIADHLVIAQTHLRVAIDLVAATEALHPAIMALQETMVVASIPAITVALREAVVMAIPDAA